MDKRIKWLIIVVMAIFLIPVVIVCGINIHVVSFSSQYIADSTSEISKIMGDNADAVMVFGAYVYDDGTPCPMLEDRILTGIAAYKEGYAGKILLTGDHGTRGYDEVNSMKEYTLGKGLEKEEVFLDHAGFSTYDSIIRGKKIFKIKNVLLSTQKYHLYRAVYIARKSGIDAYGIAADLRQYPQREMTKYRIREWLARLKDFIYVHIIKPDPVFLGEEIPITGSSSATYDLLP